MLRLFRPLEEYLGPTILTVGTLCVISLLAYKIFVGIRLAFIEPDIFP
jgi:succinate dehydrogenase/fumarate reductase cytochrome b subunit